jgi:hypothetical protein
MLRPPPPESRDAIGDAAEALAKAFAEAVANAKPTRSVAPDCRALDRFAVETLRSVTAPRAGLAHYRERRGDRRGPTSSVKPSRAPARRTSWDWSSQPPERWYGSMIWKKRRLHQLRAEPLCAECLKRGLITAAVVADHVVPHGGDWISFRLGKLQSHCVACHDHSARFQQRHGPLCLPSVNRLVERDYAGGMPRPSRRSQPRHPLTTQNRGRGGC